MVRDREGERRAEGGGRRSGGRRAEERRTEGGGRRAEKGMGDRVGAWLPRPMQKS